MSRPTAAAHAWVLQKRLVRKLAQGVPCTAQVQIFTTHLKLGGQCVAAGLSSGCAPHRAPPGWHAVQLMLSAERRVKPGMHAVHITPAEGLRVSRPAGQGVQMLAAYIEGRKVRRGQGSHVLAPVASFPVWPVSVRLMPVMYPAPHRRHTLAPAASYGTKARNLKSGTAQRSAAQQGQGRGHVGRQSGAPGGGAIHSSLVLAARWPSAPGSRCPTAHARQGCAASWRTPVASAMVPGAHGVQKGVLGTALKKPFLHGVHVVAPGASSPVSYPAGQLQQQHRAQPGRVL